MTEEWKPVPGWESAYEVSSLGRVRSVDRVLSDGRRAGGAVLSPWRDGQGYLTVTLRDGARSRTVTVHVLVLEAHAGPAPEGKPQGRHLNGNQLDCRKVNLAWGDQADNERDKKRKRGTGGVKKGKRKEINSGKESIAYRVPTVVDLGIPRSEGRRPWAG